MPPLSQLDSFVGLPLGIWELAPRGREKGVSSLWLCVKPFPQQKLNTFCHTLCFLQVHREHDTFSAFSGCLLLGIILPVLKRANYSWENEGNAKWSCEEQKRRFKFWQEEFGETSGMSRLQWGLFSWREVHRKGPEEYESLVWNGFIIHIST